MKGLNKRGFTLVEVLAVVTILAILALLVTAGILLYLQHGKDQYDGKLENQLMLAGKTYYANHKEELPTATSEKKYAYVTLPAIQSNNYIAKSFVDSEGRECSPSFVYVKQKANNPSQYDYYPCLVCQDKNGNKVNHSEESSKYCDPANWGQPDENDPPVNPQQPGDDEACLYTRSGETVTVTQASMPNGILRIFYVDDDNNEYLIYDGTNSNQTTVSNVSQGGVSDSSDVFVEDKQHNKEMCTEYIPQPTTPEGAPVCSITNVNNWIRETITVTAECHGQNGQAIALKDKSKIVVTGGHGSITSREHEQVSDSSITFSIKYRPNSNSEGRDILTIGEGTVKNSNDEKVNVDSSAVIKVDTKKPVLTYKATGTTIKATALKNKKTGYKNKVKVSISCTDSGSGVETFKVNDESVEITETYIDTQSGRGSYTYTSKCTDKAGNSATDSKTYRVLKYGSSLSKCGCAKYNYKKKCTTSSYTLCCATNTSDCPGGSVKRVGVSCSHSGCSLKGGSMSGTRARAIYSCRRSSCYSVKNGCKTARSCWY